MQQQTAPRPSRAALGVAQLRDSLGDGGDIRRSEGAGAATVPVLLISVGSRHLEGLRPDAAADGLTAQLGGSRHGAALGQPGRRWGHSTVRGRRSGSRAGAFDPGNSRHLEGLRHDAAADGPTAQQGGSVRGAAPGQPGRWSGNTPARGEKIASTLSHFVAHLLHHNLKLLKTICIYSLRHTP